MTGMSTLLQLDQEMEIINGFAGASLFLVRNILLKFHYSDQNQCSEWLSVLSNKSRNKKHNSFLTKPSKTTFQILAPLIDCLQRWPWKIFVKKGKMYFWINKVSKMIENRLKEAEHVTYWTKTPHFLSKNADFGGICLPFYGQNWQRCIGRPVKM